jgi:flagellin
MSLSINNNITSLNAWRNLKTSDMRISQSMEKLSSGLRINRGADDPAGLVISEKMRAQLEGINAAVKNSEKAINMIQTTEAALDNVGKLLVKIRQLAVDTANSGINDASMLAANQSELDEAVASITRIANYTQFGTKKLLDGSLGGSVTKSINTLANESTFDLVASTTAGNDGENVHVVVTQEATRGVTNVNMQTWSAGAGGAITVAASITVDGISITLTAGDTAASIATKISGNATLGSRYAVADYSAAGGITLTNTRWGAVQGTANVTGSAITDATAVSATSALDIQGRLYVGDANSASASTLDKGSGLTLADAAGNTIDVTSTGNNNVTALGDVTVGVIDDTSAVFQIGANETQTVSVSIQSTKAISLGKIATYGDNEAAVTTFMNLNDLSTSAAKVAAGGGVLQYGTADEIAQAIGVIDTAIDDIASLRGDLGAIQSDNLQVQLDSLRVAYENLQASESTIRDADMTREMAEFTKNQIMLQAGTAMLAQANQIPQTLLQLLQ